MRDDDMKAVEFTLRIPEWMRGLLERAGKQMSVTVEQAAWIMIGTGLDSFPDEKIQLENMRNLLRCTQLGYEMTPQGEFRKTQVQ